MGTATILLIVYVSGALGISFLCSVLEAALLSTREMELSQRSQDGDGGATRLLEIKKHRVDDAISAILTLNTIAHTVGATMAGAQAAIVFGDKWMGVFSGVLTLLVLVVTEIIPKTLGTVYASKLVGFVGLTITILMKGLTPILFFTRLITRMFTSEGGHEQRISRRELMALVAVAGRQGNLEQDVESALSNILKLDDITVSDVMTPRTVTWMLPVESTVKDILETDDQGVFSRLPLYKESRDNVEGYVLVREALAAAARTANADTPLNAHMRPIKIVQTAKSVGDLLEEFLNAREHVAIVVNEFGGMQGLVTLEDIIETLLGQEILDELDRVADLRELAVELRDRRMRRREGAPQDAQSAQP